VAHQLPAARPAFPAGPPLPNPGSGCWPGSTHQCPRPPGWARYLQAVGQSQTDHAVTVPAAAAAAAAESRLLRWTAQLATGAEPVRLYECWLQLGCECMRAPSSPWALCATTALGHPPGCLCPLAARRTSTSTAELALRLPLSPSSHPPGCIRYFMPLAGQACGLVVTAVSRLMTRASGCLACGGGRKRYFR
jgi:hypothetical protein